MHGQKNIKGEANLTVWNFSDRSHAVVFCNNVVIYSVNKNTQLEWELSSYSSCVPTGHQELS